MVSYIQELITRFALYCIVGDVSESSDTIHLFLHACFVIIPAAVASSSMKNHMVQNMRSHGLCKTFSSMV